MARVEINEIVQDAAGNVRAGESVTVNSRLTGSAATVYAAKTGSTTLTQPLTTDSSGQINGWVEEGSYELVHSSNTTIQYEAVSGVHANVHDVHSFGAVGDGTTDDAAAINAAIVAAGANGRVILRPDRTYLIGTKITLTCSLDGRGATVKKKSTLADSAIQVPSTATGVVLENLIVNGNRSAGATGHGVYWQGKGLIRNVESSHNSTVGFNLYHANCDVTAENCVAVDNYAASNSGDGFNVTSGKARLYGCRADENGRSGFIVYLPAPEGAYLSGCSASQNLYHGLYVLQASKVRVESFLATGNNKYGVAIGNSTTAVREVTQSQFGYLEVNDTGRGFTTAAGIVVAANNSGTGVEMFGQSNYNAFGTVVGRDNRGYGLAFAGCSGDSNKGPSYNRVGYAGLDAGSGDSDPCVHVSGDSNHNHFGEIQSVRHTVAVSLGEDSPGDPDFNSFGRIVAMKNPYGVLRSDLGNYNYFGEIVAYDCLLTGGLLSGLVHFGTSTETSQNNTVGRIYARWDAETPVAPWYTHANSPANYLLEAPILSGSTTGLTTAPSGYEELASAATLGVLRSTRTVKVTGTTSVTSVTASYPGHMITLFFTGALTFTDGSNLKLAGNLVTTADDTITLVCDGTSWYEVARSVN